MTKRSYKTQYEADATPGLAHVHVTTYGTYQVCVTFKDRSVAVVAEVSSKHAAKNLVNQLHAWRSGVDQTDALVDWLNEHK